MSDFAEVQDYIESAKDEVSEAIRRLNCRDCPEAYNQLDALYDKLSDIFNLLNDYDVEENR